MLEQWSDDGNEGKEKLVMAAGSLQIIYTTELEGFAIREFKRHLLKYEDSR